jgi:hypothetical protein
MTSPFYGDGLFGTDRPEFQTDDWDDQDLLTKDEARLRLEQSVRVTQDEYERARASAPERVAELELYLRRAQAVLDFIAKKTQ